MSRSGRFRVLLAIVALCSSGVMVFAWQREAPPSQPKAGAQKAAAPQNTPSQPAREATDDAKRQALLAEWAERKRADESAELAIRRLLQRKTEVHADEIALEDLIAKLAKDHGLQIWIDKATLMDEGISLEQPVTLNVAEITLRSALKLILEPLQLTTVMRDEVLWVTTATKAGEWLDTRLYDVSRLVERDDYAPLIDALQSCIDPEAWEDVGGPGTIRAVNVSRALAIRQTVSVHRQIEVILAALEQHLDAPPRAEPAPPASDPISDAELAIRTKLAVKCSLKSDEEELADLLRRLAAEHDLPLWIDRGTLSDEGISTDQPITLDLRNIRVESVLNHILRPLQLELVIEDEVLKVTSATKAGEKLLTRVFDIRDLTRSRDLQWPPPSSPSNLGGGGLGGVGGSLGGMGGGTGMFEIPVTTLQQGFGGAVGTATPAPAASARPLPKTTNVAELIDLFTSTIQPESWDDVGGAGSIRQYRNMLVIRQTAAAFTEIESLLHSVRSMMGDVQEPSKKPQPEDPNALTLVVYQLNNYSPQELAKLIPDVIAPESWKAAGGKGILSAQPSSLVIRQTPAVHKEIVKLLFEVVLGLKR